MEEWTSFDALRIVGFKQTMNTDTVHSQLIADWCSSVLSEDHFRSSAIQISLHDDLLGLAAPS
jgi:hypothetical protein